MFPAPEQGKTSTPEEEAAFRAAVAQPAAQRQAAKQAALEACSGEEAALLQCYRGGSFFGCAAARTAFWECYKKQRGFGKTVLDMPLGKAASSPPAQARARGADKGGADGR